MKQPLDFDKAIAKILSVPRDELLRREEEWKKQRKQKLKVGKRGGTRGQRGQR